MTYRLCLLALLGSAACALPEDRTTDYAYLHAAIIEPNCATIGCHSAATQAGVTLPLDLSDLNSCTAIDGNPFLLSYLRGEGPSEDYPRMPPDLPLPPGDIALIEKWVAEGAPCD